VALVLAGDQPYLTEPENLEQRALFGRIARALVGTLSAIEAEVLSTDADAWLYELLSVFHFQHPTVISLNYDTLLEAAVMTHSLWDGGTSRTIDAGDILQNTPPNPAYTEMWDLPPAYRGHFSTDQAAWIARLVLVGQDRRASHSFAETR